jgi:C1A family cysteine protease
MQSYLTGVLFLILVNVCIGQQPVDQKANAKIKGTLNLIAGLPKQGATNLDTAFKAFLTSSSTSRSYQDNSATVKKLFNLYKNEFNRLSLTSDEEKTRFASFNDTVMSLLKDHQEGEKTYTIGLNNFTDWTPEELRNTRGLQQPQGEIRSTNAKPNQRFLPLDGKRKQVKAAALPASYDLTALVVNGTNAPIVTPVKDQGSCGSCYAFAFITLLEAQHAFRLKSSRALSEQQMVDCSTLDNGCNGGFFTKTFDYLTKNTYQVNSGVSYPYVKKANTCAFKSAGGGGVKFGSLLYQRIPSGDAQAMQEALTTYGPLWVAVFVGEDTTAYKSILNTFYSYTGGVLQPAGCPTSSQSTNHAVVIVGYGVDAKTGVPYWKVRNSWGTTWGEEGYFRIRRGVNMCGIESTAFFIAKSA